MPQQNEQALISLLTICRKAGKLLLGFDAAADALKAEQAKLILLSADVSPKTEKETRFYAGKYGAVPVRRLPFDMDALAMYFRKRTGVFSVADAGFAAKLTAMLPEPQDT